MIFKDTSQTKRSMILWLCVVPTIICKKENRDICVGGGFFRYFFIKSS